MHQRRRNVKCYKPEKVNKDLPGIILLSHGPFAVSLVDTAKMLFGESENIAAYSLEPGDDIDKYREAFVEMINEFPEGSMILVDLFGGTPCNQVMRHIQETEKPGSCRRNEPSNVSECSTCKRGNVRKRL